MQCFHECTFSVKTNISTLTCDTRPSSCIWSIYCVTHKTENAAPLGSADILIRLLGCFGCRAWASLFLQHLLSAGFRFSRAQISWFKLFIGCFHLHVGYLRYVSSAGRCNGNIGELFSKYVIACDRLTAFRLFRLDMHIDIPDTLVV